MPKSRKPAPLNDKQLQFLREYLKDRNGTQAAIRAGYSEKSARSIASELLEKPEMTAAIAEATKVVSERAVFEAAEVLQELKKLVFFDPRKLFTNEGAPIAIHELDAATAKAIAGLEVLEEWEGTGENRKFIGFTKKYKLVDPTAAIEKAMRHLGLMKPQEVDHTGKIEVIVTDYRTKKK